MSDDNLAVLHELVKDPVREKMLLKLGENERLSFDGLKEYLKNVTAEELQRQLRILDDLVMQAQDDEYLLTESGVSKRPGGQYMLTEKGHNAVYQMIAFPEIKSENYREIVDKKFFSKKALIRRKLVYIIVGAVAGYCISFFGGGFLSIITVAWFHGPGWGNFIAPWVFFAFVLFVAPVIGGIFGYWFGERKNFERPAPQWDY